MTFKTHLLIVAVIILMVYLVWDIGRTPPATAPQSNYAITVSHASWGLNCPLYANGNNVLDRAYVKKSANGEALPKQDNVLQVIASTCNGATDCTIAISDDAFPGIAPTECVNKKLEVEYRCFSYDRPWHAEAVSSAGALQLSCQDKVSQ